MKNIGPAFDQELRLHKNDVDINETSMSMFRENKNLIQWSHFTENLKCLNKTLTLGELIEALTKGNFWGTLKMLCELLLLEAKNKD